MLTKIFEFVKTYQSDIIIAVAVVLMTYTGYNVGKMVAFNSLKTPVTVQKGNMTANISGAGETTSPKHVDLSVVASKKSTTHLYHFKWCSGASQISSANLLTFPTESAAISAGYKLASNCQK
jgi:hypothetical protein